MIAIVAVSVASVAQAQVYSANIVGYNKATTADGLVLKGTAFLVEDATPEGIFSDTLPVGSKIYTYSQASGYQIAEYKSGFGGVTAWDVALDLGQSAGYWVQTTGVYEPVVAGEVELADSVTNNISTGLQLLSYPYPVATSVEQLGFEPTVGDKIFTYSAGSGYQIAEFKSGFGGVTAWDVDLPIGLGEGFWYQSQVDTTWVATRPFTP